MSERSENEHILLTTVLDQGAAHIIRGLLESHNIPCTIPMSHPAGIGMGLMDIRIMVPKKELEKANALLQEVENQDG